MNLRQLSGGSIGAIDDRNVGESCRPVASLGLIIDEDALAGAFQVVELTTRQRPHESSQAAETEQQRDRDQDADAAHRAHRVSRSALATTMIDDVDIAIAAISGVTIPSRASGTARML